MLLVKNQDGIKNLFKLVALSNQKKVTKSILVNHREGLLVGSTAVYGEVYQYLLNDILDQEVENKILMYDYLEIQPGANSIIYNISEKERLTKEEGNKINKRIIELGKKHHKIVVATSDAYYITKEDLFCYDLLHICIKDIDWHSTGDELYFRNDEDMVNEFNYLNYDKAREVVIENTNKLANSCNQVFLQPNIYEPIVIKDDTELKNLLSKLNIEYLEKKNRIEEELKVIKEEKLESIYIGKLHLLNELKKETTLVSVEGFFISSYIAY